MKRNRASQRPLREAARDWIYALRLGTIFHVSELYQFLEKNYADLCEVRGQRDYDWPLQPKIDRPSFVAHRHARGWTRRHHEERLLAEFQRGARPHVMIQPADQWEWLAIAQHHGLATRLLDWTSNPLAAL